MLLEIYEFITNTQTRIGNGAKVRLTSKDGKLNIRVDWWDNDFHVQRDFHEIELLERLRSDDLLIDRFISECKYAYIRHKQIKHPQDGAYCECKMFHYQPTSDYCRKCGRPRRPTGNVIIADYSNFPFGDFTVSEVFALMRESKDIGDTEFVDACREAIRLNKCCPIKDSPDGAKDSATLSGLYNCALCGQDKCTQPGICDDCLAPPTEFEINHRGDEDTAPIGI